MFHHDLSHTGYSTSSGPISNNVFWNYTTGGGVESSPAVSGGYVYIGSIDDNIYCLNATTGAKVWSYTTGSYVVSSPAVSGGYVYVGSYDDKVYCLNATTGAKVWSYTTGGIVYSSPAVSGSYVYVGSYDDKVYCLNATTGAKVWSYTTGNEVTSSPAVAGGYVYVGSYDDNIYCLNATTGAKVWSYTTGNEVPSSPNEVESSPAVSGGYVYIGSYDHNIYCLNATTGAKVWNYTTDSYVVSSPAVSGGNVYIGSYDDRIYAFGPLLSSVVSTELNATSVNLGQSVTDTAIVQGVGGIVPTGTVQFWVQLPNGIWLIYDNTSLNSSGIITSTAFTPTVTGTYYFNVTYGGDNHYTNSTSSTNEVLNVTQATTSVATLLNVTSIILGQSVTDTAIVAGLGGSFPVPTGTVWFTAWLPNGTAMHYDTETLNGTGMATSVPFTPTAPGTYLFNAWYLGDSNYNIASSATAEVLIVAPNPSVITVVENVPNDPYSFDPQIDWESVGFEVISNIMGTLLVYNGSSTTTFLPMLATQVPTVANGEINANYTQYTFTINSNLKFSDGNPITAYDVWYSIIRNLLFNSGSSGTPGWILNQYLVPGVGFGTLIVTSATDTIDFNAIMNAVTYNNATDTVTFNLASPVVPDQFLAAVADPAGAGVLDAAWLQSIGAGITFTPAGFSAYESQANGGNYNTQVQWNPVASGPYQIESYIPGQSSITLIANPGFTGVPGIPAVNNTVVIEWVNNPQTALNIFTSGAADIVTGLPANNFTTLEAQETAGQTDIYQTPTLTCYFFCFNLYTLYSLMQSTFGSQYNVPSNYFANVDVREAFAYAFNYTNYLDEIVGNLVYGFNFANPYCGAIINGLPDYVPPSQLAGVPTYNLTYATELMEESGEYDLTVNIPVVVATGDTTTFAAVQMWAAALNQMDPNIIVTPVNQSLDTIFGEQVPGANPMPIYYLGWIADYPFPSDLVNTMYLQGGLYPSGAYPVPNSWNVAWLNAIGDSNDATQYNIVNTAILNADSSTNATYAAQQYQLAEQTAINLYMYVYTQQPNAFWVVKPYMTGYNGIQSEQNPMIGGFGDSLYYWWVK
jgi:outer membrane protein assembly factor BamB/ABC-type transport system substrate-binding protein